MDERFCGHDPRAARYWERVATLNGRPSVASTVKEWSGSPLRRCITLRELRELRESGREYSHLRCLPRRPIHLSVFAADGQATVAPAAVPLVLLASKRLA